MVLEPLGPSRAPGARPGEAAPLLQVEGVRAGYGSLLVLEDVSFTLERGSLTALVGPNGAGKSTLFQVLLGLLAPWAGTVRVQGRPVRECRFAFGYLPQHSQLDLDFPVTVRDVVMMGRYARLGPGRWPGPADRAVVERCLAEVGLAELAERPFGELSGGQRQRILLARALAQEAPLLLLDEPLSEVDTVSQQAVFAVLARLAAQGAAILVATHDLALVSARFDRVICLNRRVIADGPPAAVLTEETLTATYQSRMVLVRVEGKTYAVDTGGHR
ncbi:MAG TPA: metal ABC transporter ATP-binding protein [Chloroflexota bacterium]|nr:metal ABC transporter ATP-binding protein [Chloroflexota bacterium]